MFELFKKKSHATTSSSANAETTSRQEITADSSSSSGKVILSKANVSLDKKIVSLKKETGVDLSAHIARVFVVLDRSGSMDHLFLNGSVQETLTRILPLALRFDDNGELEVYLFNNSYNQMEPMTEKNFETYVSNEILKKGFGPSGGTSYAPVIKATSKDYNDDSPYPAFGIFITDGENNDRSQTDDAIRASSKLKIFYQFIGIGSDNFRYLQELDDLSGRSADNTAFCKVSDFRSLSDDELYEKLLEQYPAWLKDMGI